MTSDPSTLLAWMRGRGPGDVPARAISDAGPRPFRRRAEAGAALAVLIEAGALVEVSGRPRVFRVVEPVAGIPVALAEDDTWEPTAEQISTDEFPIPMAEIRELLASNTARHAADGLSDAGARYMAARDLFETLKADPRLAPVQIAPNRCNVCGGPSGELFLRVGSVGILVHPGCLGEHRRVVAERIDDLVVKALA